ncbi:hypothetical protein [Vibrio hangzhouensis]|uniref:Uncharacterized protein n=1 Tax=Vibrio hangzhouensis TaxID=462991 RepID=A0A1H5XGU1_9VIBR|nr:hypothetical protein [Vibrio hangzhouensis]SEG10962.1 hypothetical protein SAMN04488244_10753 [Vibrio hangzhouensis]
MPIDAIYGVLEQFVNRQTLFCIASNAPHEKMAVTLPLTKLDGYFENTVFIALAANITSSILHYVDDLRQTMTFV